MHDLDDSNSDSDPNLDPSASPREGADDDRLHAAAEPQADDPHRVSAPRPEFEQLNDGDTAAPKTAPPIANTECDENVFLEARIVFVEPSLINPSKFPNRLDSAFTGKEQLDLEKDIEACGGNIQPVKLRPIGDRYETVWGDRRVRACLKLGLKVRAIVENLTDAQAFQQMISENSNRSTPPSPYEQGMTYASALQHFKTMQELAAVLRVDRSKIGKAILLAQLPPQVIAAFPDPNQLQYRWAAGLHGAYRIDKNAVLNEVKRLRALNPPPSSIQIYEALTFTTREAKDSIDIKDGDRVLANWTRSANYAGVLRFSAGAVPNAKLRGLMQLVEDFLLGKLAPTVGSTVPAFRNELPHLRLAMGPQEPRGTVP